MAIFTLRITEYLIIRVDHGLTCNDRIVWETVCRAKSYNLSEDEDWDEDEDEDEDDNMIWKRRRNCEVPASIQNNSIKIRQKREYSVTPSPEWVLFNFKVPSKGKRADALQPTALGRFRCTLQTSICYHSHRRRPDVHVLHFPRVNTTRSGVSNHNILSFSLSSVLPLYFVRSNIILYYTRTHGMRRRR